jgi:hypothetical protein
MPWAASAERNPPRSASEAGAYSPARVVHVDHGDPDRHVGNSRRISIASSAPVLTPDMSTQRQVHRTSARRRVATQGHREVGDRVAAGDGHEGRALLGEARGEGEDEAVGMAFVGVALDLGEEADGGDRDASPPMRAPQGSRSRAAAFSTLS